MSPMLRKWSLVALAAGFPIVVAVLAALLLPRIYASRVLMVPVIAQSEQQTAGASVASGLSSIAARFGMAGLSGTNDAESEAIATITSRLFMEGFVQDNQLMSILFEDDWDQSAKRWLVPPEDIPTSSDAYQYLVEDIVDVNKDLRTGLVTLTVKWKDRELAAQWANELVQRINEKMRQRAIQEADEGLNFLSKELELNPRLEIQQAIYRIIEMSMTQGTLANVQKEYAFRVIDPAVVADADDFASPRLLVIAAIAALLSSLSASCVAMLCGLVDLKRLLGVDGGSSTAA